MKSNAMRKYKIASKPRFMELYNFAMQYPEWKMKAAEFTELKAVDNDGLPHGSGISDPTADAAASCETELRKIKIVETCAKLCAGNDNLRTAVLKAVTTPGITFKWLKAHNMLFYEKDAFYIARRKFYYLLDKYWV